MKSQGFPKVIVINPEGNVDVCTKFQGNPSQRYFTLDKSSEPTDRQTSIAIVSVFFFYYTEQIAATASRF